MNAFRLPVLTIVMAVGFSTLIVSSVARAIQVLEFDFRTAPVGTDVAASFAIGGASAVGELKDGATVNMGSTGMSYANSAALRTGYLVTLQPVSGNSPGMDTKDTGGVNNRWDDYMGSTAYGSGTAIVVYRPHYTNDGGAEAARRSLWMSGNGFTNSAWLMHHGDPPPAPLAFMDNTSFAKTSPGFYSYDDHGNANNVADDWYFMAMSWTPTPGGGDPRMLLYVRPITGGSTSSSLAGSNTVIGIGSMTDILTLGRRNDGTLNHFESANGDFALFQLYNDYRNAAALDALYAAMVPEPSFGLIPLCGLAMIMRRHRRHVRHLA